MESHKMHKSKPNSHRHRDRSGVAMVELAVCLPAIVVLVIGGIECANMIFVKQSLHIAAYEGMRLAVQEDVPTTDVIARTQQVLDERRVHDSNITFDPANPETLDRGTTFTMTIDAPAASNSPIALRFFDGDLESFVTMVKE